MIHVQPNHTNCSASASAAAALLFPAISGKSTHSLSFTLVPHQKPLNTKYKLGARAFHLHYSLNRNSTLSHYLFLSAFSLSLLILRLTSTVVLPDFPHRWRQLIAFSSQAEAELIDAPDYLFDAAVAYEDRRFFTHVGVDAIGVARAVLSLSARGGGSTITQQLVKNTLLKNERTFLRKSVEMVLAVELERRISKLRILSAYLCKIYWGHGIYGIKSASEFYFGKHPSVLTLGECALLVGMIPAPEVRSPFRDYSRGKTFQARVLKRMVDGRFLDVEAALSAMRESDSLGSAGLGLRMPIELEGHAVATVTDSWDWERQSYIWEAREEIEKWAMSFRLKNSIEVRQNKEATSFQERRHATSSVNFTSYMVMLVKILIFIHGFHWLHSSVAVLTLLQIDLDFLYAVISCFMTLCTSKMKYEIVCFLR